MDYLEAREAKRRKLEKQRQREERDGSNGRTSRSSTSQGESGVSSSSFVNLKAQLSQHQAKADKEPKTVRRSDDPFSALEARSKSTHTPLPADFRAMTASTNKADEGRTSKKKKTHASATTTLSHWSKTPSAQLERERAAALERKANLYDQLKKGLSGGLKPEDLEEGGKYQGMVDWDRKVDEASEEEQEEESERETLSDEEQIEYTDDLGRTRLVPRSQVPMEYLMQIKRESEYNASTDDATTIYGPQSHFPVFQHDQRTRTPLPQSHFDASHEIRNRGAGFYQFDQDEEARRRQMEELEKERIETERARSSVVDGLGAGERRLRERRAFVEAKKRELQEKRRATEDHSTASTLTPVDAFLSGVADDWRLQQRQSTAS